MHFLISGATGLVGSALCSTLESKGHRVSELVRRPATSPFEVEWYADRGVDPQKLSGFDGVVHLAGENLAAGRWTAELKARIRDSRLQGTYNLAQAIAASPQPPPVLVTASAIGYYGDRGDEVLTEDSPPGRDFLADVAIAWELASQPAEKAGVRVVRLRFGFILSPKGGGLGKMLLPFKLGVGGKLGSGNQWMSWVSIADVVAVIERALEDGSMRGTYNTVSPNPVTNAEFTRTLASVLRRPAIFPVPAFVVKAVFGEMGEQLLLASQRVEPARLKAAGYSFRHGDLRGALEELLRSS